MRTPRILVAGILDTKGREVRYLADRVRIAGGAPLILELSVGGEIGWADIGTRQVLAEMGHEVAELGALSRTDASELVTAGAIRIVQRLIVASRIDGMIALGGSMGTSMATRVMQVLPIGLPKIMLSTMASGDVRPYVGTRDIAMLYPIAEVGLNRITRRILNNGAAAVVGMANAVEPEESEYKPLIGCTMFGSTTPCVLRAAAYFEERGFDVMVNHAVGSGGRSMEELISEGHISGMLDITTHEITAHLLGGVLDAGPDRLTAAGRRGTPQVVSVGGMEVINFGPRSSVPAKYETETNLPGRTINVHTPANTYVGVSEDEAFRLGAELARKINLAIGPTVLCVPLRGWSAVDIALPDKAHGWAGPGHGPVWSPDDHHPERSFRCRPLARSLRRLVLPKPNVEVIFVDRHMNDPDFADLLTALLDAMLRGSWKKGTGYGNAVVVPIDEVAMA